MHGIMGTGHKDVGKHTRRAAKDVVLQLYAFVDGDIVLDAHSISYFHIVSDVDVLT
jgi:hypothetical protein